MEDMRIRTFSLYLHVCLHYDVASSLQARTNTASLLRCFERTKLSSHVAQTSEQQRGLKNAVESFPT